MQILPRPSMLSLLRLRSSVVATTTTTTTTTTTSSSTAQYYAASALPRRLPAVLWRPPAPARRASPHPLPPDPPAPRLFRRYPNGSRGMATTSGSGIKGDSDDTMAEADNGERDGRRTAAHNGDGDKHTRKKKIVLLCGDGPPARTVMVLYTGASFCGKKRIALRTATKGSLIEMTGPKRGIELCDTTLIEYDMRIKMDGEEEDDLQLIDGVSLVDERTTASAYAFTKRIHGDCGAVDITVSRLDFAVEATIEIRISE